MSSEAIEKAKNKCCYKTDNNKWLCQDISEPLPLELNNISKKGAVKCAGLDVRRYDIQNLEKNLPAFKLIANEEYTFINPKGDPRPYIYTLFKRIKND